MEDENLPLLKYRIIGASTEDPENPLYSIISGLKNEGWSSVRYCTYPQEILIQLCRPCRLRQLHLVLHEYKIPTKIEIYYFFPKTFSDFNLDIEDLIFEKMGHIIPDSNAKSKYQAREFKKIFMNENVYYLKLVFHQNYPNLKNIFNQVGLIALQCFGVDFTANNVNGLYPNLDQPIDYFTKQGIYPQLKKNEKYNDSNLDEVCILKLQELKEALDHTVKLENYDQAKAIHEAMQVVRKIGEQINSAIEMKKRALEINDFDACKLAKNDIDFLREKVKKMNPNYIGLGEVSPPIQTTFVPNNMYGYNNDDRPLNIGINNMSNKNIEDEVSLHAQSEIESKNVVPETNTKDKHQLIAVKGSENEDGDEEIRETVKYKK